ncbi:regulatory protein UhpC [Spirochaetia bacterium]|nr:regulatory protein UhpC [Spirochaetia bacterium]
MMGRPVKKPEPCFFLWLLCWVVYAGAYFGRVNLSIALPSLSAAGTYSRVSLGLMASGFFAAYAAGQLINGALGDRLSPRWFVTAGLAVAGLSNILFGLSGSLPVMVFLWALNGYAQSMLWGPLIRLVSERSPPEHLHKGIVFLSTSPIIGYFLSYAVVGRISLFAGIKAVFFIPGIFLILIAGLWFLSLRQSGPRSNSRKITGPKTRREGLFPFILRTRLWAAALICIMGGIVKEGLVLWGPNLLSESQSLPMEQVLFIMSLTPLMNLPVLILSGWVHKTFRQKEKYTLLIFSSASLLSVFLLRAVLDQGLVYMGLAFSLIFAALYALNNILTSFVPLNFYQEKRISTVAGFLDCAVYIGAAISGPLSGLMADSGGWKGVTECWIAVVAITIPLCFISLKPRG